MIKISYTSGSQLYKIFIIVDLLWIFVTVLHIKGRTFKIVKAKRKGQALEAIKR